jgi:hypothetical protein
MAADYETVSDGLHEVLADIESLAMVIEYEPLSAQSLPLLYSIFENYSRSVAGTVATTIYTTLHRLVLSRQDPQQSEATLRSLVDAIPRAVEENPTLGRRVSDAQVRRGEGGYVTIGGVEFRSVDFHSEVEVTESLLGRR